MAFRAEILEEFARVVDAARVVFSRLSAKRPLGGHLDVVLLLRGEDLDETSQFEVRRDGLDPVWGYRGVVPTLRASDKSRVTSITLLGFHGQRELMTVA